MRRVVRLRRFFRIVRMRLVLVLCRRGLVRLVLVLVGRLVVVGGANRFVRRVMDVVWFESAGLLLLD